MAQEAAKYAAEDQEEQFGDHKYFEKEKELEQKFDVFANRLAQKNGFETVPWLELTQVVVWIFLVLVLLQMLKRTCFISLTVAMLALYVLEFPNTISR